MEVKSLQDAADDLKKLKVRIFGISMDSVKDQASFCKKQKLEFDLLSDEDGEASKAYGAKMKNRNMPKRITFIIDPKGVLRAIIRKVNVRSHGKDVVEKIKELQKGK